MPDVEFTYRGFTALQSRLDAMAAGAAQAIDRALTNEASAILNASQKLVPVSPDGGTLRDTGTFTSPPVVTGIAHTTTISYASDSGVIDPRTRRSVQAYAIALHEHPSAASPRSWAHKPVLDFTKSGTGTKYLERPFNDAQPEMLSRFAQVFTDFLNRHAASGVGS